MNILAIIGAVLISIISSVLSSSKLQTITLAKSKVDNRKFAEHYNNQKLRQSSSLQLREYYDMIYYGKITIGTPGQVLSVQFDLLSADLWVLSSKICSENKNFCANHVTYDHSKSKTFKSNNRNCSLFDGFEIVDVSVVTDVVNVGEMEISSQTFGEASCVPDQFNGSPYDGVFGLAYPNISYINATSPFMNLMNEKILDQPVFAFYLNRSGDGGELVFGGVQPSHFIGTVTYTPVVEQSFWKIGINRLSFGSINMATNLTAIPVISASVIAGPSNIISVINSKLPTKCENGVCVVDCDLINDEKLPELTLDISGTDFVLQASDYIIKVQNVCISSFISIPGDDSIIGLGNVFMRKYYTVFDMRNNRVGFALASNTKPSYTSSSTSYTYSYVLITFIFFIVFNTCFYSLNDHIKP